MITISLDQENKQLLTVESIYDSGTHKGVKVVKHTNDWRDSEVPLNKILTKEQILGLEAIIATTVNMYLEEEK